MKIILNFLLFSFLVLSSEAMSFELGAGVHIRKYPLGPGVYVKLLKESGITSYREDFPWGRVEKAKGIYSLDSSLMVLNDFITETSDEDIKPVLILDYGNKVHTNNNYPTTESEIEAFANYAYWTAKKYKGKIKVYEVWNEWLVKTGVPKEHPVPSPDVYFELVKAVSLKIREADPEAKIIAGAMNPLVKKDREWIAKLASKGIMAYIDGVSVHPYSYMFPDKSLSIPLNNLKKVDLLEDALSSVVGRPVDIYITEFGYPNNEGKYGVPQNISANWILQYTILAKSRGYIKGIWWYDFINDGVNPNNKEDNFGFFYNDLLPKKSAAMLSLMLKYRVLDFSLISVQTKSVQKKKDGSSVDEYIYTLKKGDEIMLISCPAGFVDETTCTFSF